MQGSWYKYFLRSLRYYYRSKGFFLFFFKFIIILKIISIFLDIYFGYFPNIFKDNTFWFFFFEIYNLSSLNFLYWWDSFWLFIVFIFLFFWFFKRIGFRDNVEILRRKKLKEQQLKNKEKEIDTNKFRINLTQKKIILKKKIKKLESFINKHL